MFSKILRQLRLEQKLTQSDMAKMLNISRVAYTNYELGNREPSLATTTRIAAILGTTVDFLLGNSQVRFPSLSYGAVSDATMKPSLRLIMLSATDLSSESCAELQKFVDLLKIRDQSIDGHFPHPDTEHPLSAFNKNGGSNNSTSQ